MSGNSKMVMPYVKPHVDLTFFETAPWKFVNTCVIEASVEEVFAIFEDGKAWPIWFPKMTNVNWTSPKPYGVGTTRDVSLGSFSLAEYFIRWEGDTPTKRFSFCLEGQNQNMFEALAEDYLLEPIDANSCKFTYTVAIRPVSWTSLSLVGNCLPSVVNGNFKPAPPSLAKFIKNLKANPKHYPGYETNVFKNSS